MRSLIAGGIYLAILALLTGTFTLHMLLLRQNISAKEEELREIGGLLASYETSDDAISMDQLRVVSHIKGGQPSWAMRLQDLSSLLPPQMWLTEISLDRRRVDGIQRDVLQVSGSTYVTQEHGGLTAIVDFLNALREHKGFSQDFESIKLLSSKRSASLEREELTFKFICLIRR
jgi:Tfp pilus assembly protein PilN